MPEGDAVRRTASRLDRALAGGRLQRAELRVPQVACVELRGMRVLGTAVHGKHLLTRLTDGSRDWTLHHHLRMDGSWRTGRVGPPGAPSHRIRVWLATSQAQAVGVNVHMLDVRRTTDEHVWVGHLGPDIMADAFDAPAAALRLADTGRPLVPALLDQRLVAGMGTMWAAELAAAAGANPRATTSEVDGLADALEQIRKRMLAAVAAPPATTRRSMRVFERKGWPCRVCGTPILAGRVGDPPYDRPTYWCPSCQPPPGTPATAG